MKKSIYRIFLGIMLVMVSGLSACVSQIDDVVVDLDMTRCLQPLDLTAKVTPAKGDEVTFSWTVAKGSDQFLLELYSDPEMTQLVASETVLAADVPFVLKLEADEEYYYRVQGQSLNGGLDVSKWAKYDQVIKTFAVKSGLNPEITDRTAEGFTLAWTKDDEVTHITIAVDETVTEKELTADEIAAAKVTVTALSPSTLYQVGLYFKSANRGDVVVWTRPDTNGSVEVSTTEKLLQSIKDGAPKILVKASEVPYEMGSVDIVKGVFIYGEEGLDGARPVLNGELNIVETHDGEEIHIESIELNGAKNTYGFTIQLKNQGKAANLPLKAIHFKNCTITGYSKGLIYEWGQTMILDNLIFEGCTINEINKDGSGGGDVVDFRGASNLKAITFTNNSIYTGGRTFFRFDATPVVGDMVFSNNTVMNLCLSDNTNNSGLFGFKEKKPTSLVISNNLFLNMITNSFFIKGGSTNLSVGDLGIAFSNNYFYNIVDTFWSDDKCTNAQAIANGGGNLDTDPCYNADGGVFNLVNTDLIAAKVGASQWQVPFIEQPEDLTLGVITEAKTWDLTNAKFFQKGNVSKSKVRDNLLMRVSSKPIAIADGILSFSESATMDAKKGIPVDCNLEFKVDKPGSVYIMPVNVGEARGNHVIVSVNGIVKGGAAVNEDMTAPQKILISDITEESTIYIYSCGTVGIKSLAWALDTTQINTALESPVPVLEPESVKQGTASEVKVSWEEIPNAASYSVIFNGKTYPVSETEYIVSSDVVKFLDAGGYQISVYANPGDQDIYNTQSSAGNTTLVVVPQSTGGGGNETIVNTVQELANAIASGKVDITLAHSAVSYDLTTLELTTPLRLKGEVKNNSYPTITGNIMISGDIKGSIIFRNIDFDGTNAAGALFVEGEAIVADTIALYNCNIHDYPKALYDNSKKYASSVQYMIYDGVYVANCSDGSDFIDMRNGAYHNLIITNSTFAQCARTFIRTDASSEINYVTVRNNTFYKVSTNSSSKDNNGLFHIRGTAGSGLIDFKITDNLFYSIKITEAPSNANGYPKFISKSSAAIKPNTLSNNFFYNIEEDNADYTWWTANCSREEGIAGGGAVLTADPCKYPSNGDFTLTNAVVMNANAGDPRWNPMAGGIPSSEITVNNITELLTAISANKSTITLAAGNYDLTALTEVAEVSGGVLTLTTSLNLIANNDANFIGGFKFSGENIKKFSATGINFIGKNSDESVKIGNMIDVSDATVNMASVSLNKCNIESYSNRLYSQSAAASLMSFELNQAFVNNMGTSGDFIDIRKGTATAVKVVNNTFANGIRTFMRIDKDVACGAISVQNNTFYNIGAVDSKDNNGIFHVRATSMSPATFDVQKNLFGSMHRANATPSNANGYPKLVSANTASIIPTFAANYYYDIDTDADYNWWNRIDEATGIANYGVIIADNPFKDAASGDFTLTNALAMSENIGDPRWNPSRGERPTDAFKVASVEEMLTAISAGKTTLSLAYGVYDLIASTDAAIAGGSWTLSTPLTLIGESKNGQKPEIIGGFKFAAGVESFAVVGIKFTGTQGDTKIGNMLEISDATVNISNIGLINCDISSYANRLLSMSAAAKVGSIMVRGLIVSNMGTSGDCIDIRKGTANLIKIENNTFYDGIRTFLRVDKDVVCGAIAVKNNTFYNLCAVDSKDNNGILHVRATSLPLTSYIVENNIFAAMHRAVETPSNANGFPKLVSTNSASLIPTFRSNIFFDFDTTEPYSWWSKIDEATAIVNNGLVLTDTPFAGDPTTGKFTVKAQYKGLGDTRW